MSDAELRERLKRLAIRQGTDHLRPKRRRGPAIEELLSGEIVDTDHGSFFLYRERHPLDYRHGHHALTDLLAHSPQGPALLARDDRLAGVDFRGMAFVDTETTGLAGGTGTYAFLVGVGLFEGESFTVHQFFMRDFHEEPALLHVLGELLDGLEAVVSFNGKSFDLPLLETRFLMARQVPRLVDAPHLDLLPAARRFWRYRLPSCALSSLEAEVLGVQRTHDDVPGWLIPGLYTDYARSGDAREMPRIFYHNVQDILSLVTLTARMCDLVHASGDAGEDLPAEDLYGLARVLGDLDQLDRAEAAYARVAQASAGTPVGELAMRDLAYLLKRQERREEALAWWQQLVETAGAVYACEELAKHYEWHDEDLVQARAWTERALALAGAWPPSLKRRETLGELQHRLERLDRKLSAGTAPGEPADESMA
jgi:uncharacterized protein YprB with RNaseH-like and TPR domain